jgi:hypothetical protein
VTAAGLLLIALARLDCQLGPADSVVLGTNVPGDRAVLGYVAAAAFVPGTNRVVVLDSRLNRLLLFDCRGRFIATAGRAGGGPGEFAVPVAMRLGPDGTVHILDAAMSRISRFRASGDSLVYLGSATSPVLGQDFCLSSDGDYVVQSPGTGLLLHHISTEGNLIRSFAPSDPAYSTALAGLQLNRGFVDCSFRPDIVVLALSQLPLVTAFRSDGRRLWTNQLAGHRRMLVRESPRQVRTELTAGGSDFVIGLARIGASTIAVQLGRVVPGPRRRGEYAFVTSYLLRLADGQSAGVVHGQKRVLLQVAGSAALFASQSPFPQVIIGRLPRGLIELAP